LKYLSVCSGIEAATVAWHPLGWEPVAFSEIEKFPSTVLAHHYPTVPNLGDMTQYKEWNIDQIDLLAGGTPCQSFSVAGLRKGLDDPRGNLCLVYLGLAERFRPRWILWENVPGVLSSGGGRDFGSFLGALAELGYGWAYRVLNAQYFGVPQRRRRVFVVGYLGDWRSAAAVLFERHSLSRNPPPSREKREETAPAVARSLTRRYDSSEDGTGRGLELIPVHTTGAGWWKDGLGTLRAREQDSHENLLCMAHGQGNAEIRSDGSPSLTCNHEAPIVFPTLDASHNRKWGCNQWVDNGFAVVQENVVGFQSSQSGCRIVDAFATLDANNGSRRHNGVVRGMQVRRLTAKECERLQGFPDDYTNIPWRGKSESPDGPRYKALGNSMAVPCMRWIGERIAFVEKVNPFTNNC